MIKLFVLYMFNLYWNKTIQNTVGWFFLLYTVFIIYILCAYGKSGFSLSRRNAIHEANGICEAQQSVTIDRWKLNWRTVSWFRKHKLQIFHLSETRWKKSRDCPRSQHSSSLENLVYQMKPSKNIARTLDKIKSTITRSVQSIDLLC